MNVSVENARTEETPPQVITLTLTPEEFAVLENLRWRYLGGSSGVRSSIEEGFNRAVTEMHSNWRDRVVRARYVRCGALGEKWAATQIAAMFAEANRA